MILVLYQGGCLMLMFYHFSFALGNKIEKIENIIFNFLSFIFLFILFSPQTRPHTGSLWLDLFQNSRNIVFAKIWHFLALVTLKDTKKTIKYWKRPTKAVKVILEARESKNGKILILLHFCDHLVSKIKRI